MPHCHGNLKHGLFSNLGKIRVGSKTFGNLRKLNITCTGSLATKQQSNALSLMKNIVQAHVSSLVIAWSNFISCWINIFFKQSDVADWHRRTLVAIQKLFYAMPYECSKMFNLVERVFVIYMYNITIMALQWNVMVRHSYT